MKRRREMSYKFLAVALAFLTAVSLTSLSIAEEDASWGFGKVVSVDTASNKILISEYDYENESEKTTVYTVNADTELVNDMSLWGITIGSEVSVEYKIGENGRKIATYIDISGEEAAEELEEEYDVE
jgi:hypothetical protein